MEVYSTRSRYYLCHHTFNTASDCGIHGDARASRERVVRVLKVDRTSPLSLRGCVEDQYEYTPRELRVMLDAVGQGNKGGVTHECSAVGIIGAVRFLRGLYLVFATRREVVARILGHPIYAVTETKLLPIAMSEDASSSSAAAAVEEDVDAGVAQEQQTAQRTEGMLGSLNVDRHESRYRKLLASIGTRLTSGFYYSPTYPLHRRMQKNVSHRLHAGIGRQGSTTWDSECTVGRWNCEGCEEDGGSGDSAAGHRDDGTAMEASKFRGKYTWNAFIAKPFLEARLGHWLLSLVHGSVTQVMHHQYVQFLSQSMSVETTTAIITERARSPSQ